MKSFPWVKQLDSMQCGMACISMVCLFYKKSYRVSNISTLCRAGKIGVSIAGIEHVAGKLGFNVESYLISINNIAEVTFPCILHWNQNHFVVLYEIGKNGIFKIADPGKGLINYNLDEFKKHWISTTSNGEEKGVAMFLEPTQRFYEKEELPKEKKRSSFRFLLGYLIKYRSYFAQIVLGLFIGSLLQLLLPFLTQNIVDVGIKNKDVSVIWLILLGQLVITLSRTFTDVIRRWLLLHISMRINISLVSDFFIKLLQLPMSFFDTKLMGDLLQRISDHSRVNTFLTQQTLNVAFSVICFAVFGCVLFYYNVTVFLIFLAGSIVYGLWMALFMRRRKVIDYELFEQQSINNNKTYQFLTAMQEIKLQNCEERRRWEWEDIQADLFQVQIKSLKLRQTQEVGNVLINEIKDIVITFVSAMSVINGELSLGMMLAVQYIIGQLNGPIEQLMHFIYSVQDVKISLERINEIHKIKSEDDECRFRQGFDTPKHDIQLNNVEFKYNIYAPNKTIDGVNLVIPEGKITAIVGASGSGKTTLLKLILGYYPLTNGKILIAGNDISEYNMKWWRQQCGVVMQDGVIFSESIARNIAVDDNEINMDRLMLAAEIANVKDFVNALPLRFDTIIGNDGIGLSLGQKQRILIARAIYKNPQYIFLDEATNSLDANNERMIVSKLDEFYKGRTVVIVAHRLSTVRNADQIVVLEKGKIVEIGNHSSLTAKQGAYYNLVKNQLELGN